MSEPLIPHPGLHRILKYDWWVVVLTAGRSSSNIEYAGNRDRNEHARVSCGNLPDADRCDIDVIDATRDTIERDHTIEKLYVFLPFPASLKSPLSVTPDMIASSLIWWSLNDRIPSGVITRCNSASTLSGSLNL